MRTVMERAGFMTVFAENTGEGCTIWYSAIIFDGFDFILFDSCDKIVSQEFFVMIGRIEKKCRLRSVLHMTVSGI